MFKYSTTTTFLIVLSFYLLFISSHMTISTILHRTVKDLPHNDLFAHSGQELFEADRAIFGVRWFLA